jgi:DoxX-like family
MSVFLWIVQALLAAVFAFSAFSKGFLSKERLAAMGQTGVAHLRIASLRAIAFAEGAAVVGLIVPWAADIARVLTPLAAVGLGIVMVGAARVHSRLREPKNVTANIVLLALSVLVAVGRFRQL